jgi:hypothetical protein
MNDTLDLDWLASQVPGASDLIAWFGYWPSFHDAEVTSIELVRSGTSRVSVHTFGSTGEIDAKRHYVCTKHVVVSFLLNGISELELTDFNHQNVLACLLLTRVERGYELKLQGLFGVDGVITAESVSIELVAGAPPDSQYLTEGMP